MALEHGGVGCGVGERKGKEIVMIILPQYMESVRNSVQTNAMRYWYRSFDNLRLIMTLPHAQGGIRLVHIVTSCYIVI